METCTAYTQMAMTLPPTLRKSLMPAFEIARFLGAITQGDITAALGEFQLRHGHAPYAVAVHPTNEDAVATHLAALGLGIPITANGGAWSDELWLQTNDTESAHA